MILVISKKEDAPTVELVTKKLSSKGESFFVLDTTDLHNKHFALRAEPDGIVLEIEDTKVSLQRLKSVWVRRPFKSADSKSSALNRHIQSELKAFTEGLIGVFAAHGIFVLNDPHTGMLAANKVVQWDAFRSLGIRNIATQFSNMLSDLNPGETVVKQLANKSFSYGDADFILPTKVLGSAEIGALKKQHVPPLLLQDLLKIDYEVRATIVDKEIFAARIDYDSSTTQDYRLLFNEEGKVTYSTYKLPKATEDACFKIMDHFGLYFGSIDVAVGMSGEHWVLELNPNGQWGWLEDEAGLPIADAIAELLAHPPKKSQPSD